MKYLLSFLLITFFFVGCSTKQEVEIKLPDNKDIGTPIIKDDSSIKPIEEEIEPIVEDEIIEDEMPIIDNSEVMKLAVIYPSKIVAKYAKSSINTILAYFDYKKIRYELKVFDTLSEDELSIQNALTQAKEEGFINVIALFTPRAIEFLHLADTSDLRVYLPLTNKQNLTTTHNNNFIYGAISYKDQVNKLFEYSNTKNTMFYQSSFLTNKIKSIYESTFSDINVVKEIKKDRNYFKGIVKDYRLKNSTLFLNTPIVKTSIVLSQLRAYNIYPKVILSTQINYNPKVLTLTQAKDRSNLVLANSIDVVDDGLRDTISSYGADIIYNWVDYSTLIGVNYLYDENSSNLIATKIEENQVIYEPKLVKTTAYGFLEIK